MTDYDELYRDTATPPWEIGRPQPALAVGFPMQVADVLVLKLLGRLLRPDTCQLEILSLDMLIAERIAQIERLRPAVVCVSSLPPGGWTQARALCKSLRSRFPDLQIIVGRWSGKVISEKNAMLLQQSGASAPANTGALLMAKKVRRSILASMVRTRSAMPAASGADRMTSESTRSCSHPAPNPGCGSSRC